MLIITDVVFGFSVPMIARVERLKGVYIFIYMDEHFSYVTTNPFLSTDGGTNL